MVATSGDHRPTFGIDGCHVSDGTTPGSFRCRDYTFHTVGGLGGARRNIDIRSFGEPRNMKTASLLSMRVIRTLSGISASEQAPGYTSSRGRRIPALKNDDFVAQSWSQDH